MAEAGIPMLHVQRLCSRAKKENERREPDYENSEWLGFHTSVLLSLKFRKMQFTRKQQLD
jgi:hypothetical protein